jgi:hypothetical protein
MYMLTILVSVLLSIFSTAVMSYIAMATPIGPWIAPTLVLLAIILMRALGSRGSLDSQIAYATVSGSVGGILATACGFSFPALYFIDPILFESWLKYPGYFCIILGFLSFLAGWFGIWIANGVEQKLIVQEQLPFPIGQLVQKMIAAHNNITKAYELLIGFLSTALFCVMQDGTRFFKGLLPKSLPLLTAQSFSVFTIPSINFDLWPLLWAIGFVTGHVVAFPLVVGALVKIFFMEPINKIWFSSLPSIEFVLAFCGGLVLSGAALGCIETPQSLYKAIRRMLKGTATHSTSLRAKIAMQRLLVAECVMLIIPLMLFLSYMGLTLIVQLYLILFTWICSYQMVLVAGKIGLAQLGRYATFVMVPALFLFDLKPQHLILIATFVELSGGIATDILFGRKLAHDAHLSLSTIRFYQYFGLLISSLTVGIVFWLFINHFTLGSAELFAYKAQSRALLLNVQQFNYIVLFIGFCFGLGLKWLKMNPALVLGGLLMPMNISLGLIAGGFLSYLVKEKEEWYPFWSGVFASNSLWMLIKTIL